MKKKPVIKKKRTKLKSMKRISAGYEKSIKNKKENPDNLEDFEKVLTGLVNENKKQGR